MAVFVLGAGATRGASFVSPTDNPCLPPLDADFYAQLQRIQNKKHKSTIDTVIQDTVELFGVNFNVTMETVFTTLEHTERMIQTTGENRDFKRSEINAKKENLKQAIAATLEEALCAGGQHEGTECVHHRRLVEAMKEVRRGYKFQLRLSNRRDASSSSISVGTATLSASLLARAP